MGSGKNVLVELETLQRLHKFSFFCKSNMYKRSAILSYTAARKLASE